MRRLTHIRVITAAALRESVRRKDIYVVWMLAVFCMAVGAALGRLGLHGMETLLRELMLTVVNVLATLACILLAARQLPEELDRRTLYPLLARPVRRVDVLLGKFLAVWIMSALVLAVLSAIAWANLAMLGTGYGPIFWQYFTLRLLSFAVIAALAMLLSLLTTPAATVTLAAILTLGATLFAQSVVLVQPEAGPAGQTALRLIWYVLPHLDLLDLSRKTAYNWPPIPAAVVGQLAVYAGAYAAVFLGLGSLRFRRMAL